MCLNSKCLAKLLLLLLQLLMDLLSILASFLTPSCYPAKLAISYIFMAYLKLKLATVFASTSYRVSNREVLPFKCFAYSYCFAISSVSNANFHADS